MTIDMIDELVTHDQMMLEQMVEAITKHKRENVELWAKMIDKHNEVVRLRRILEKHDIDWREGLEEWKQEVKSQHEVIARIHAELDSKETDKRSLAERTDTNVE